MASFAQSINQNMLQRSRLTISRLFNKLLRHTLLEFVFELSRSEIL